ncbi:hypothetical protein [uncultured Cohaesibacter sp.]|uniref:hypothetical protein n=1 Tax=uncultured Cohaesibacter sp. TaxID=1002546 RepID=UPI002AA72D0A|nr:hypothetical protein [uncultured Cohaesibacter sp.]
MKSYNAGLVQRANKIGIVTEAAFMDACQEVLEAPTLVDLGSIFSAHLGTVRLFGGDAVALFTEVHTFRKGELQCARL